MILQQKNVGEVKDSRSFPLLDYGCAVFQPIDKAVLGNLDGGDKFDANTVVFAIEYPHEFIEGFPVVEGEVAIEFKLLQL
jgi:hypothetical protein